MEPFSTDFSDKEDTWKGNIQFVFKDVSQQVYSFCRQTKLVKNNVISPLLRNYLVKHFSPLGLFCYFLTKIPTTKVFSVKQSTKTLAVNQTLLGIKGWERGKASGKRSQKLSSTILLICKQSAQGCLKESLIIIEHINPEAMHSGERSYLVVQVRSQLLMQINA